MNPLRLLSFLYDLSLIGTFATMVYYTLTDKPILDGKEKDYVGSCTRKKVNSESHSNECMFMLLWILQLLSGCLVFIAYMEGVTFNDIVYYIHVKDYWMPMFISITVLLGYNFFLSANLRKELLLRLSILHIWAKYKPGYCNEEPFVFDDYYVFCKEFKLDVFPILNFDAYHDKDPSMKPSMIFTLLKKGLADAGSQRKVEALIRNSDVHIKLMM